MESVHRTASDASKLPAAQKENVLTGLLEEDFVNATDFLSNPEDDNCPLCEQSVPLGEAGEEGEAGVGGECEGHEEHWEGTAQ